MIGLLLSVIGFLISYFGITHDDVKPYFRNKYIKWSIYLIFALSAIFDIAKSVVDGRDTTKMQNTIACDSKKIDSLNGASKALTIQIDSFRGENRELNLAHSIALARHDSNTIDILAKYGYKVDSFNNTLAKLKDKVNKEIPPSLTILDKPTLFVKDTSGVKQSGLTFVLYSLNADSHITNAFYTIINIKNNQLADTPFCDLFRGFNYTQIIPAGVPLQVYLPFAFRFFCTDTFVIALNFDYKSKGDKQQTPFRGAYTIVTTHPKSIQILDNFQFGELGKYLKKYNIWDKLYSL